MNLFDKLLDSFSAKDLRLRVRVVVVIGAIICAVAAVSGVLLMKSVWETDIAGTGAFVGEGMTEMDITLDAASFDRVRAHEPVAARIGGPGAETQTQAKVVSIDPENRIIRIEVANIPPDFKKEGRFNVKLILLQKPFWELLWGQSSSSNE